MNFLHQAMRAVLYRLTATARKMASKVGAFSSLFCLLLPWRPPGQYGVSSCPMVMASGFR
jgi:hypothetical protein